MNADGTRPVIYIPGTQFSGSPVLVPGNVIPASLINPYGKAIMNMFSLPNNPSDPNNNYILQYQRSNPRYSNVAKVDWNVSDATHTYVRYSDDEGTQVDRSISNSSGILPGAAVGLAGLPAVFPVSDDILPAMTFGTYPAMAFNRPRARPTPMASPSSTRPN